MPWKTSSGSPGAEVPGMPHGTAGHGKMLPHDALVQPVGCRVSRQKESRHAVDERVGSKHPEKNYVWRQKGAWQLAPILCVAKRPTVDKDLGICNLV